MLTYPQAMTFQKINIAVYHQHKSDKIDHEILQYHLNGKCTESTARGPTRLGLSVLEPWCWGGNGWRPQIHLVRSRERGPRGDQTMYPHVC